MAPGLLAVPGGASLPIGENMAGKPLKRATARMSKSAPVPEAPAREPAAAMLIAKRIEEDIVLGRRQPRERLIEQDLCDLFQTHRGDVRLALFELEKKGLVERIPNRGAMVRGLTPLEVREIYAVREELEVMAVRIIPFPVSPEGNQPAGTIAAAAQRGGRQGRSADGVLQQPSFSPDVVRPVRQCLPDRDHRFAGAEGLRHSLLRPCVSAIARPCPPRSSGHDQGAARLAPGRR